MPKHLLFVLILSFSVFKSYSQPLTSVLGNGDWFKFSIAKNGIYKIDYNVLKDIGLNPDDIDPKKLQIYGNGAGMLPQKNNAESSDRLLQNSIYVQGEDDGVFNSGDYLLFYAQGPDKYSFDEDGKLTYERNLYTNQNYYFLTIGENDGLRVVDKVDEGQNFPKISSFHDFQYYEDEKYNLLSSGREWYSEKYDLTTSYDYKFNIPGLLANSTIALTSAVMAQSFAESSFSISINGKAIGQQKVGSVPDFENPAQNNPNRYSVKGQESLDTFNRNADGITDGKVVVNLTYNKNTSDRSIGYLNYLILQAKRKLALYDAYAIFRNTENIVGNEATFEISSINENIAVWDITDPLHAKNQEIKKTGNTASFGSAVAELNEYIVFDQTQLETPEFIGKVLNQNIKQSATTDLIIVTHPDFKFEAERLASFRTSHDNLSASVFTTTQIYNEFASGKPDPTAIRNFLKYQYDKSSNLKYVLLFGKGSYDYKDFISFNTNFVPVYESRNSLHPLYTYASDDYYGFMEDEEGEWLEENGGNHTMEIGVGRIPVSKPEEAKAVVDKIIHYSTSPKTYGPWRNDVVFVADDEDGNTHVDQSNRLSVLVDTTFSYFNYNKIYLDAFPQISTPNGVISPKTVEQLNKAVEKGALVINFTGHGGENVWMQEQILTLPMIRSWKNKNKLPLFVTATCEFGRHDDPFQISGGEVLVTSEDKGAIAIISTCRPVYSASNFQLNKSFYNEIFNKKNNEYMKLGDIVRLTKNNSTNNAIDPNKVGNRNFALLGDPSLTLNYPKQQIVITSINNDPFSMDTLHALSKIKMSGKILEPNGQKNTSFSGILDVLIFDKESSLTTLGNGNSPYPYKSRENVLFRGKATIKNGDFEFEFIVPKNISYIIGKGKISLYALQINQELDANGADIDILIGGTAISPPTDRSGPKIQLYFGDSTYTAGTPVNSNTLLVAKLEDESGINISNYGLGNDITAKLDENETLVLNDYYNASSDTYKEGWLAYPLENLEEGKHSLTLKAWDTYNNSSELTIEFTVSKAGTIVITNLINYPNPVKDYTTISFEHNRAGEDLNITLQILSRSGQVIYESAVNIEESPAKITLRPGEGDANFWRNLSPGLYLFKVLLRSQLDGAKNQKYQKLILTN